MEFAQKSVFIISKRQAGRYSTSCINKHAGRNYFPFSEGAGGVLLNPSTGDPEGWFTMEVGKGGRVYWLFVVSVRRYSMRTYPNRLISMCLYLSGLPLVNVKLQGSSKPCFKALCLCADKSVSCI